MTMIVKPIAYLQTYDLRHRVLRPHQPVEAAHYLEDHQVDCFHFGAFEQDQLIGVVSLYQEDHPELSGGFHYRLRGMAVEPKKQDLGVGKRLLQRSVKWLQERKTSYLWCNARVSAAGFYEKQGFLTHGPVFDLPPIGPHKVLVMPLDSSI